MLAGRRPALTCPPQVLVDLLAADARDEGDRALSLVTALLDLAHAVVAVELPTTDTELDALARYRAVLLGAFAAPASRGWTSGPRRRPTSRGRLPGRVPSSTSLAELHGLVGLTQVEADVQRLADLLHVQQLRAGHGLPTVQPAHHLVPTGNPGTGKTSVARLLAELHASLGTLRRGRLVEVGRGGLVAGYVGQTAERALEVVRSALDGVLLIDEAYALVRGEGHDDGREAIDAAGLLKVARTMAGRGEYQWTPDVDDALHEHLVVVPRGPGFGNARDVRNLFEAAVGAHASRIVRTRARAHATRRP